MAKGKYQEWLTTEGIVKIEGWARDGLGDEQIAHNMGISPSTFYDWKKKYSEISEALKKGKEVVDRMVENALLKRALGYQYEEVTEEESEDGFKRRVTVKEVVPDTTAQIFWLKNRKPAEWRDKQNIEHSGKDGGPIQTQSKVNLSSLSDKELEDLERIIAKSADTPTD